MSKKKQATKSVKQAGGKPPIELSDDLLDKVQGAGIPSPPLTIQVGSSSPAARKWLADERIEISYNDRSLEIDTNRYSIVGGRKVGSGID